MYTFERYTTRKGRRAVAVYAYIDQQAALPHQTWGNRNYWATNLSRYYSNTNEYVPTQFTSIEQMRKHNAEYVIPESLRRQANRASANLVDIFQEVAALRIVRDQEAGILDPHKMGALVSGMLTNTYNPEETLPYMQIYPAPTKKPTIGLVFSLGNGEMHNDPKYVGRIGALSLGIGMACEAAGLELVSAITKGAAFLNPGDKWEKGIREAIHATYLAHPNRHIPARSLVAVLSASTWQVSSVNRGFADKEGYGQMMNLFGYERTPSPEYGFLSVDGGAAVDWIRQCHAPDVVIAIGKITDAEDADIHLSRDFDILTATDEIARQARRLVR